MKIKNKKNVIRNGLALGLFFAMFSFLFIIGQARAGIIPENVVIWDSTFDANLECNAEKLEPVSYGQKSNAVTELQKCLKAYGQNIKVTGKYDTTTKREVKDFYFLLFQPKKTSGKKFDKKMVALLKEMRRVWETSPVIEETTRENLDTETQNAKYMVESTLNNVVAWRETIQNCPTELRKLIEFFYGDIIELTSQEQAQYEAELEAYDEEFQNAASEFDTSVQQSQEAYDAGNYKEAETLSNKMIEVLGQASKRCDSYKNEPSKVYKQRELVLQKEQREQEKQYEAEEAAKEKKKKDAIAQIKRYFEFTIPKDFSHNVDPVYDPDYYDSAELVRNGIFAGLSMANSSRQVSIQLFVIDAKGAGSIEELYSEGKGGKGEYGTITKTEKVTLNGIRWHHAISAEGGKISNDVYAFLQDGKIYRVEIGLYDLDNATYAQVLKDFKKFVQGVKIK